MEAKPLLELKPSALHACQPEEQVMQSAFVGSPKECEEGGDAQEEAAVCRGSLPWCNEGGGCSMPQ